MALACLVVALLVPALAAGGTLASRELRRTHDPVIVRTALLGDLPDRRTAQYRVFAARDGRVEPIPFQFDPMTADGRVLFGDAAAATFDADDELVLMAQDTGDRIAPGRLPAGGDIAVEIEATDVATGARGWAYLMHFPGTPPPPSPVRYVRFADDRHVAEAFWYTVRYAPPPTSHLAGISVAREPGGGVTPLIEGTHMRIGPTFSLLLTNWSPVFTERSFTVTSEGVRNGPVRAVRRVRQALDLGRLFPELPSGTVQTFYYASAVLTPSTFEVPSLVLTALRDFRFEAIHDFGARAEGTRYWDAANRDGVPLTDGRTRGGTDVDQAWWVASGDSGTLLNALVIPRQWRDWGITRGTVLSGDDAAPPDVDATGVGYRLRHMTNLRRAGAYALETALMVLPTPYRPGDEADALAMLDTPLAVSAHRLPAP